MRLFRRRLCLVPLLTTALTIALATSAAAADPRADAEALIGRGIALREQGKDDEALVLFREAYAKAPTPRGRAQIALAEQALGMWTAAESDLSAALASADDAWIAKNRAALDGALAVVRRHLGTLEVRGAGDADVFLDGARVGSGGGPFRAEAGTRRLEVRAKGFQSTSRSVEIPAGGAARETVTLVADESHRAEAHVTAASRAERADASTADPGAGQRLLGWALVGGGGALALTGVVGLLVRKGVVDDYNERCPGLGAAQTPACEDKVDAARTWMTVSIVSLVGAGVAAVAGGVLVGTAPNRTASARISCSPGVLAASGVLACAGTF